MTEFVVSADGTRIAVEWSGAGQECLVYAHGAGSDRTANPELKALLATRFRILSYDRRGRGGSGDHLPYSFDREVDDLKAVIAEAGDRTIVMGISMGARVALEVLRSPPDLAGMILFEPPATDSPNADHADKIARIEALIADGDREAALVLHNRLLHGRTDAQIAEMRAKTEDWRIRLDNVHVTLREMRAIHCDALFDPAAYRRPGFPVHLLVGDETLPFLRGSADLVDTLPFVSRVGLKGLGHSAPRDHPEEIADVVLSVAARNP